MKIAGIIGVLIASVLLSCGSLSASEAKVPEQEPDVPEIIFSHILDSYEWHITTISGKHISIYLPVIVRSPETGWHIFSSRRLSHGGTWEGFRIASDGEKNEGKIVQEDGTRPLDISITKNVLALMISCALLLVIVLLTARWYRTHDGENEAPKGLAAFVEPLILMVHDMARENIGEHDYRRFSPFLCTAFFFILLNNFLGIVPFFPGGANLTGNIAITLVLALCTFFTVHLFGTKTYYRELFSPEVPGVLKPVMSVIEIFSALMKPMSLTVRLFANMMAGHILILCLVCLIFVMAKCAPLLFGSMTAVSVFMGIFSDILECLVAFIQAYIFTMLSSIYIGMARHKE